MKVVPVFLRYDYGIQSRGESLEVRGFYPALQQTADEVYPFWFDEYLDDKDELQKKLVEFVEDIKPDIVFFILMKDEFSFETLDYLREKYTTINWFGDDQWRFEDFTKHYAPHFTYSVTTDKFSVSKYQNIGYNNVIFSQWASFGYAENIDFDTINFEYDVSFVGGISRYRKWIIGELQKKGIKVECFGHGWKNGKTSFEKMEEIFRTSKINLNISNSQSYDIRFILSSFKSFRGFYQLLASKKRIEQIKARNFEIPAFGGFQLTNYAPSLEDYFTIGHDVVIYTNPEDLALQIDYFLSNETERKSISLNGYQKAKNEYTYQNYLYKILNAVG